MLHITTIPKQMIECECTSNEKIKVYYIQAPILWTATVSWFGIISDKSLSYD